MIVTILRHGEAGDAATDRQRQLTARGSADIHAASARFETLCGQRAISMPQLIAHSPWLRTQQTADIMAAALPLAERLEDSALKSEGSVAGVEKSLTAMQHPDAAGQHVLLVSHQPLVSYLLRHFLGPECATPPLSPGCLASINMDIVAAQAAELLFWATPPLYEAQR